MSDEFQVFRAEWPIDPEEAVWWEDRQREFGDNAPCDIMVSKRTRDITDGQSYLVTLFAAEFFNTDEVARLLTEWLRECRPDFTAALMWAYWREPLVTDASGGGAMIVDLKHGVRMFDSLNWIIEQLSEDSTAETSR